MAVTAKVKDETGTSEANKVSGAEYETILTELANSKAALEVLQRRYDKLFEAYAKLLDLYLGE